MKRIILAVLVALSLCYSAIADVLVSKDGSEIECSALWVENERYVCERYGAAMFYSKEKVDINKTAELLAIKQAKIEKAEQEKAEREAAIKKAEEGQRLELQRLKEENEKQKLAQKMLEEDRQKKLQPKIDNMNKDVSNSHCSMSVYAVHKKPSDSYHMDMCNYNIGVSIRNKSSRTLHVNPNSFTLIDGLRRSLRYESHKGLLVDLQPGTSVSGFISFNSLCKYGEPSEIVFEDILGGRLVKSDLCVTYESSR